MAQPPALDVLGLGESSVDHVNLLPTAPLARGTASKLRISSAFDAAGGQIASMLAACSGLGLRSGYLGPLGSDDNGRLIRNELERRGVDLSNVLVRDAPARFAIILVDESTGERTVLWHRDPGLDIGDGEIDPAVLTARILHVDDVDEQAAIWTARAATARATGSATTTARTRLARWARRRRGSSSRRAWTATCPTPASSGTTWR